MALLSSSLVACGGTVALEELALEATRGPVAERIGLEAGAPPQGLELSLLAAEVRRDTGSGPRCRVLVGARFRLADGEFVGMGDLFWDENLRVYRFALDNHSPWRPWESWSTPLARSAIFERFFAPDWAFGKGEAPDGASVHREAWQSLFGVDAPLSYPPELAAAELRCE